MPASESSTPSSSQPLLHSNPQTQLHRTLSAIEAKQRHTKQSSELAILHIGWEDFLKHLDECTAIYSGSNSIVRTNVHSGRIFKVAASPEWRPRLAYEARIHHHVLAAFDTAPGPVKNCIAIPRLHRTSTPVTGKKAKCLLRNFRITPPVQHACGLLMERIRPVPWNLREYLCQAYAGVQGTGEPSKLSCLVSVYLGSQHAVLKSKRHLSSTELLLTQHELRKEGLPIREYTHSLADALAILHWHAKLDGKGVKFALGRPRQKRTWPITRLPDDILGPCETFLQDTDFDPFKPEKTLALWMLGFSECKRIEPTKDAVSRLVECYWDGEPWFPRPPNRHRVDGLWDEFAARYVATASMFVEPALPQLYIAMIEDGGL